MLTYYTISSSSYLKCKGTTYISSCVLSQTHHQISISETTDGVANVPDMHYINHQHHIFSYFRVQTLLKYNMSQPFDSCNVIAQRDTNTNNP